VNANSFWRSPRPVEELQSDRVIDCYNPRRASEACGLRWQDVELDEDTGLYYLQGVGKGSKPFTVELMLPEALDHLKEVFYQQYKRLPKPEVHLLIREPRYKPYTFKSGRGAGVRASIRRPFTPPDLCALIAEIGKEAAPGVIRSNKKVIWSPHMLRRSCASILAKQGCSIVQIQRYLCHASAATTLAHYVVDDTPLSSTLRKAVL